MAIAVMAIAVMATAVMATAVMATAVMAIAVMAIAVMPAKAGIQVVNKVALDASFRWHDSNWHDSEYKIEVETNMLGIPTWVIILFIVLCYFGIKRCYTRTMPLKKIAIAPTIFLFFGLTSANNLFGLTVVHNSYLILGTLIGFYLGYLQVKNQKIRADKKCYLIQIPGDSSLLISLVFVFFIEFIIHYAFDAKWKITEFSVFYFIAIILNGFVMGLTLGRCFTYLHRFYISEHSRLAFDD